ncbi:hypothetical protein HGO34_13305 [Agrobacterium vitis]|uniref:Uncharacterized protein n=1 Tax=Agrobacterium vitis TaxID=373 RepID=A0AAE5AWS6_AGRVI|nr:hypothetical protein [Agrobacterium vitis]MCF1499624.1 hypothetical protein [Allorhizobium sp. Av2]MCM2440692.1 hypothetical protein [Agrobacterium vitis]MUZ59678.1 hypothetical protein [Agrobacterium vitis]MVA66560.1 hypothetical protein [Agrobacterium vitis]MVA87421.1 hypothetical protein [Agrobacterium vitis]
MKDQCVTVEFPTGNRINEELLAEISAWLSENRDQCGVRIIPTLKEKFGLGNLEAIEAAKRAHALQYGRAL